MPVFEDRARADDGRGKRAGRGLRKLQLRRIRDPAADGEVVDEEAHGEREAGRAGRARGVVLRDRSSAAAAWGSGPDRHAEGFTRSDPVAVPPLDDPTQDAHVDGGLARPLDSEGKPIDVREVVESRTRSGFIQHPPATPLDDRRLVQ